jgi:large subunit ribosomal protein L10
MAKTRQQKEQALQELSDNIKKSKSVVFVNFNGLKVNEAEELRKLYRSENISYSVAKKTLIKLALEKNNITGVDPKSIESSVGVAIGYEDEVAPARLSQKFSKEHTVMQMAGGILEGQFVSKEKVVALALLPSKEELLAKVVGSLNAPVSGFVNVLAGNLRGLVYALSAIRDSKN